MSWDELLRGFATGQGALVLTLVVIAGIWAARRLGVVEQLKARHELAAAIPAFVLFVLAGLQSGKTLKESAITGAVVILGPLFSGSPPLPAKADGPNPRNRPPLAASLVLLAALSLTGCTSLLPSLVQVGNTSHLVSSYLGLLDTSAQLWADAHPDDTDGARRFSAAVARCRQALLALERLGASAAAYEAGDVSRAKDELLQAYAALYQVAQELGLIPGGNRGAVAARADARQVDAITPAELAELLQ